jgi:multidrug efflux pump subunit AcrA (membrane-fusion protein)
MTTDNRIIVENMEDVIAIPRTSLFGTAEENYVFVKKGGQAYKQKVTTGIENEEEVVIKSGLNIGDKIFTRLPSNADEIEFYEG